MSDPLRSDIYGTPNEFDGDLVRGVGRPPVNRLAEVFARQTRQEADVGADLGDAFVGPSPSVDPKTGKPWDWGGYRPQPKVNGLPPAGQPVEPPKRPGVFVPAVPDYQPFPLAALPSLVREAVLRLLRCLPLSADHSPTLYPLEPAAKGLFVPFNDAMMRQVAELVGGPLAAALPKLVRQALRLALIHQLVTDAHAGPESLAVSTTVGRVAMTSGIFLAGWFHNQAERVYATMAESPEDADARRLVELVRRKAKDGCMTPRDLQRANCRKYRTTQEAELALNGLVRAGYGEWIGKQVGAKCSRTSLSFRLRMTEHNDSEAVQLLPRRPLVQLVGILVQLLAATRALR